MMDLTKFYDNVSLINTVNEIDYLNEYYKTNFQKYNDFEELISPIYHIVKKNSLLLKEIKKQFINNKALQPGVLSEINIFTTVAHVLGITQFLTEDNQYIGENEEFELRLVGNLGHTHETEIHDIILIDKLNNKTYACEIKEHLARATDKDLKYDENGRLYRGARQTIDLSKIQDFIDYYNQNITVFGHFGHNFPISAEHCTALFLDYFKNIDYIFTYLKDKLLVMPKNQDLFTKIYSFKGSEVRGTNGKNKSNIFTPKYFERTIAPFIIKETDKTYTFKYDGKTGIVPVIGRGKSVVSSYNIPYGFKFAVSDVVEKTENSITVLKSKIKQLNPNISIHIKLNADYDEIKKLVLGG